MQNVELSSKVKVSGTVERILDNGDLIVRSDIHRRIKNPDGTPGYTPEPVRVHRHIVCVPDTVTPEAATTPESKILLYGNLLTRQTEEGREAETIIFAKKIVAKPADAQTDISIAQIVGKTLRDPAVYGRDNATMRFRQPGKTFRPFTNLRVQIGDRAFCWLKGWDGLFTEFQQAVRGAIVQMKGNLGYVFVGENNTRLTEIAGNTMGGTALDGHSRVLMIPAQVDEFADFVDDGAGTPINATNFIAPGMSTATVAAGQAQFDDEIPF